MAFINKAKAVLDGEGIIWLSLITFLKKLWLDDWKEISEEHCKQTHNILRET